KMKDEELNVFDDGDAMRKRVSGEIASNQLCCANLNKGGEKFDMYEMNEELSGRVDLSKSS
ncbi:hypothetical protein Tco_1499758, partial [Tanacetum coccineum]